MKHIRSTASLPVFALALSLIGFYPFSASAYIGPLPVAVEGAAGTDGDSSNPHGTDGQDAIIDTLLTKLTLRGGIGGSGYNDPDGLIAGMGGNGGNAIVDLGVDTSTRSNFSILAYGGQGGEGFLANGGNGGSANNMMFAADDTNGTGLTINANITGGKGGAAFGGNGGNGADAIADNEARGFTSSSLNIIQRATGGAAGNSDGGNAGLAGNASSTLAFHDKTASSLVVETYATGGMGGGVTVGGTASAGGTAKAITNIVSENTKTLTVGAYARGGNGYTASLDPYGYNPDFDHYAGSPVTGSDAKATADAIGSGDVKVSAEAYGGDGSKASGLGQMTGSGGNAEATAYGTSTNGGAVNVSVRVEGGSGGVALNNASTGNGADVFLENVVGGQTTGALSLTQKAIAGLAGGYNRGTPTQGVYPPYLGTQGDHGFAKSIIAFADDEASSLTVHSYALAPYSARAVGPSAQSIGNVESLRTGATVDVFSEALGTSSMGVYLPAGLGWSSAGASAKGTGARTLVKSMAHALGEQGSVDASSHVYDVDGNSVKTTAYNKQSLGDVAAATTALIGGETYQVHGSYIEPDVKSYGNVTAQAAAPVKRTSLGTTQADYTVVADGSMGAAFPYYATTEETFFSSASYTLTSLSVGQDLLFGLTDQAVLGAGFKSATFSLTQGGSSLYSGAFSSMTEWENFFESPLYLGTLNIEGPMSLEIAMSQVIMGRGNGYSMDYAFVVAPEGTVAGKYTDLVNVPLPAAAPLFVLALAGLGGLGYRKKK